MNREDDKEMIIGSFIFGTSLFMISIFLLIETIFYPFKARLFPLLTLIPVLFLLIIQLVGEIPSLKDRKSLGRDLKNHFSTQHLVIGIWMACTLLMMWIIGFMGTVLLLPFLYLRFQRESWRFSIGMSLGSGIFFYLLFDLALNMPLYPGLFFLKYFA